jgi:hypothetical protein
LHQDVDNRREGGGAGTADLAAADYQAALDHVSIALTQEKAASSGQPGFVPPAPERRGRRPSPPLDDFVFMSRDPIVSIAQSALEYYFRNPESKDKVVQQDMPDDRRLPVITDARLPGGGPRRSSGRRLLDQFSITDPHWVSSLVAMGVRKLRGRHAFNPTKPEPVQISDQARVIFANEKSRQEKSWQEEDERSSPAAGAAQILFSDPLLCRLL